MNASLRWLEAFLRRPLDPRDVASRLAMLGAPVDAIEPVGADLSAFVVGLVTSVAPHPDADKLRVTTVDDGSGTLHTVVCGAPNVTAGHKYPFARLGTTMPGGLVIERRKIRGQVSEGMLCSARELELGTDHDGIYTLDTDAEPGTPLTQVLAAGDTRLVIDVTPNRPDLFGHKGIARELAASYTVPFRLPEIEEIRGIDVPPPARHGAEAEAAGLRFRIEDPSGCGRLLVAVVRGVTVGPSPRWLAERLQAVGVRSINNVVDITNYLLLELNQPMHAYDAATLEGKALVVRAARDGGEALVTLDGVARKAAEGTLLIADATRPIGIAGVMGGRDTEVTDSTRDVVLECAWFDPRRVRAGRRAAGLSTDASQRFERGTDRWGAADAFRRAIALLQALAGGTLDAAIDLVPETANPPRIFLRPARVAQVLGIELAWSEIERCLVAIGATVVSKPDDGRIAVDVPGWRPDLQQEIDLVEEVARIHGYDNIPTELRPFRPGTREDDPEWTAIGRVRRGMAMLGLSEVMTLEMRAKGGSEAVTIANPLSADHAVLRDALLPALVEQVEANWSAHQGDVRLFEIGRVFAARGADRPHEEVRAAFVVTGARRPAHWTSRDEARFDAWDARWLFERMVALADSSAAVQVEDGRWVARAGDGTIIGTCLEQEADAPVWASPVWGAEVRVVPGAARARPFAPLPEHPAVVRDLALLVGTELPVVRVTELLRQRGAKLHVESVDVVDEFRGGAVPSGKRSVAVRLVFRSRERTLTDAEVDQAITRLVGMLERECDVALRSA